MVIKKDTTSGTMGTDTADAVLARGQAMLDQTAKEGSVAFAGSSYEKALQTTTSNRKQTKENSSKFDEKKTRMKAYDEQKKQEKQRTEEMNAGSTGDVKDPYEGMDDQEKNLRLDADKTIKRVTDTYDRIEKYADDGLKSLIRATKDIYSGRIERTEASNKRLLAMKNVTNIRSGRNRYTPDLASDILSAEEMDGESRVNELEGELLKAVADAENARAKDKMKNFNDHFNNLQTIEENLRTQIKDNYDRAVKQDEMLLNREKEARLLAKEESDAALEKSKRSAPALAAKLKEFNTSAERTAFIEAYAEQTGIDPEILMGDITGAMEDSEKRDLEMSNIENQIYNRNRSENRLQAKQDKDAKEEDDIDPITKNVLADASVIDDLSPEKQEKVKADLRELGFYNENPPEWFIDMKNEESSQTLLPEDVKKEWETHRKRYTGSI